MPAREGFTREWTFYLLSLSQELISAVLSDGPVHISPTEAAVESCRLYRQRPLTETNKRKRGENDERGKRVSKKATQTQFSNLLMK